MRMRDYVIFNFKLAALERVNYWAKYTVMYLSYHSWNSGLTSDHNDPCKTFNSPGCSGRTELGVSDVIITLSSSVSESGASIGFEQSSECS